MHLLAAQGWIVTYCNPRGSSGQGLKFCNCIEGQWGEEDWDDMVAFTDWWRAAVGGRQAHRHARRQLRRLDDVVGGGPHGPLQGGHHHAHRGGFRDPLGLGATTATTARTISAGKKP